MFVGLHEAGMVFRLPESDRDEVVAACGAAFFEDAKRAVGRGRAKRA